MSRQRYCALCISLTTAHALWIMYFEPTKCWLNLNFKTDILSCFKVGTENLAAQTSARVYLVLADFKE